MGLLSKKHYIANLPPTHGITQFVLKEEKNVFIEHFRIWAGCENTDNGATDIDGDSCYQYQVDWCVDDDDYYGQSYDDEDFVANEMCCVCGGGSEPSTR